MFDDLSSKRNHLGVASLVPKPSLSLRIPTDSSHQMIADDQCISHIISQRVGTIGNSVSMFFPREEAVPDHAFSAA
ncbi:hypothetical protein AMTR_s00029p00101780 [Amborella trichopoda]|uniref:Uncharacterized protein n=1 Tax=Amborella trichopoda TaxID=13333 RepID=W1PHJ2_AMBTC|nr:hypothetical protein AMTR_s00029p00101780 [Amborella trichopoda]